MKGSLGMSLIKNKKKIESKKNDNVIVQENIEECIYLVENSFLKGVFTDSVTDVSYNGLTFFAQDNNIGRYQLSINATNDDVIEFIKKIANYMLQPFSTKNPSLDVSFGDYRLNAVHPAFARNDNKKVITFSLRKISATLKIKENDPTLCPLTVHNLLRSLMLSHQSILISGQTGAGKTEFQKYLISLMDKKDRIIIIEESYETHIKELYPDMDITTWIVNNQDNQLSSLVKVALRNNPDWLIVAETRGIEAYDMVQAAMTGHSAITTIHSESAKYSLDRIVNMCKKSIDFDEQIMFSNIAKHIKIGINLEKIFDQERNKFIRRISEIVEYIPTDKGYKINTLFQVVKNDKYREKFVYKIISKDLKNIFIKNNVPLTPITRFIKETKKNED